MEGFFSRSKITAVRKPLPLLARCGECGLSTSGCETPFMPVSGKGRRKIMIVGEAPGQQEDEEGVPFVGKAGQYLRHICKSLGVDISKEAWLNNALICRPPNNIITNKNSISCCRPNLLKEITKYEPEVIILLGRSAIKSLIGFLWKEDLGELGRWVGWQIPCQRFNCWICPTWHPSFIKRLEGEQNRKDRHDLTEMFFTRHLKKAFELKGRPWKKVPDYKLTVKSIMNVDQAAKDIKRLSEGSRSLAFDFETNMLKPDSERGRIVCCSISDGKETIVFPWHGRVIDAMKEFVKSKPPKIASNMKFEERWTRCKLKTGVRNWDLDTMLAAHVLDNRPDISSIKFQSFIYLGQEDYDSHIKPFLKTKDGGGYTENRIKECDLNDLLLYCGMDSLLEWKVAKGQKEDLND